jgi:hypothetical protein
VTLGIDRLGVQQHAIVASALNRSGYEITVKARFEPCEGEKHEDRCSSDGGGRCAVRHQEC